MDKDLKKAVLAAFDEDGSPTVPVPAPTPMEKPLADQGKGVEGEDKRSPTTKRELAAAARRSSEGTGRRPGGSGGTKAAAAAAAAAATAGSTSASRGREKAAAVARPRGNGALWFLNALTLVLLLVVLAQAYRLQKAVDRLSRDVAYSMKDIRNYSRLHVTTYAEPGKPPQQVTTVVEIKDGVPKVVATEICPLKQP